MLKKSLVISNIEELLEELKNEKIDCYRYAQDYMRRHFQWVNMSLQVYFAMADDLNQFILIPHGTIIFGAAPFGDWKMANAKRWKRYGIDGVNNINEIIRQFENIFYYDVTILRNNHFVLVYLKNEKIMKLSTNKSNQILHDDEIFKLLQIYSIIKKFEKYIKILHEKIINKSLF